MERTIGQACCQGVMDRWLGSSSPLIKDIDTREIYVGLLPKLRESMPSNLQISDFLDPVNLAELSQDQGYKDGQIGKLIDVHD